MKEHALVGVDRREIDITTFADRAYRSILQWEATCRCGEEFVTPTRTKLDKAYRVHLDAVEESVPTLAEAVAAGFVPQGPSEIPGQGRLEE